METRAWTSSRVSDDINVISNPTFLIIPPRRIASAFRSDFVPDLRAVLIISSRDVSDPLGRAWDAVRARSGGSLTSQLRR